MSNQIYAPTACSLYLLHGGFDVLQVLSGGFGEQTFLLSLPRKEPRFLGHPDPSLVTRVSELSRLIIPGKHWKNRASISWSSHYSVWAIQADNTRKALEKSGIQILV